MSAPHRPSLRYRYRMLGAQLSLPTLLSQLDEDRVISVVASINGIVAILVISLAAWWSGLPLLFPSLAPSAFILFTRPFSEAASPRSMVLGHATAIGCGGIAWVTITRLLGTPVAFDDPDYALCVSGILAFGLSCFMLIRLHCPHPPACASALIVASGGIAGWLNMLVMVGAVVILAFQSVLLHRMLGVRVPVWRGSPRSDYSGAGRGRG